MKTILFNSRLLLGGVVQYKLFLWPIDNLPLNLTDTTHKLVNTLFKSTCVFTSVLYKSELDIVTTFLMIAVWDYPDRTQSDCSHASTQT